MTETQMLTVAAMLVSGLFGLLAVVIGWIGSKAIAKLDQVVDQLSSVKNELHTRINGLDNRLVKVETQLENPHVLFQRSQEKTH